VLPWTICRSSLATLSQSEPNTQEAFIDMVRFIDLAEFLGCPAAMHATVKVLRFDSAGPNVEDI